MKKIRLLAQYHVDLMVKLGLVRFSLLLALVLVILAIVVQLAVTLLLSGHAENSDIFRPVFFGLLITPWVVYFFSVVVGQLRESKQRLARLLDKMEELRQHDMKLNQQMEKTIARLNHEIADRINSEQARLLAVDKLKEEMKQRERTQVELEQQSSFLRSFLDASPDLVFYRNIDQQFSGCNRAMELLTGKSEKQLIGLTPEEVFDREAANKVLETDEKVFRYNVSLTYEQWLEYPDGRKACFEIRKVPYYDRVGKRSGLMGFGRDVTERKRYQDALENASREKTTFISTISHELRTPLNGIVGLSRILLDSALNPEQLSYLKTIHVSAITLGNIFNDINEMEKIERHKVQIDIQPVDLTDFLTEVKNLSGLLVQPKGLQFVLLPIQPLPDKIMTDGTRLRQILWNLISNAVKFTQKGKIIVRVAHQDQQTLRIEVEDSGIGIPQKEQSKIFAMYYQVEDKHGGKSATGTGIGLAISKRLAQSMGGDISVSSTPGNGATFTVTIQALSAAEEADKNESDNMPLPVLNVLLVEDIELNVIVARSVLEKLGSSVEVAMTGQEALNMFDPVEHDLVLLDIQLPDMTGMDVAREIRQRFSDIKLPPMIALTANVLKDKQEYLDVGMSEVLSKPLGVQALESVIKKFWDHPPVSQSQCVIIPASSTDSFSMLLDVDMLRQYLELAGSSLIWQGIDLFKKIIPTYLAALESGMARRDRESIAEEGHKIKGAAGAIGLIRLQQRAQQIQQTEIPGWWDNVQEWIEELRLEWQHDLRILEEWLSKVEKNDPSSSRGARKLRQHQGNRCTCAIKFYTSAQERNWIKRSATTLSNFKNAVKRFIKICDEEQR